MSKGLIIFGTAEIAQLAREYFEEDSNYSVKAFTVDEDYIKESTSLAGLPVIPFSSVSLEFPPHEYEMHVALSYARLNAFRKAKYMQCKAAGYNLASYIASSSIVARTAVYGDNCFILENQTIQPYVTIGSNVMIWSGNHIGHG